MLFILLTKTHFRKRFATMYFSNFLNLNGVEFTLVCWTRTFMRLIPIWPKEDCAFLFWPWKLSIPCFAFSSSIWPCPRICYPLPSNKPKSMLVFFVRKLVSSLFEVGIWNSVQNNWNSPKFIHFGEDLNKTKAWAAANWGVPCQKICRWINQHDRAIGDSVQGRSQKIKPLKSTSYIAEIKYVDE